MHLQTDEVGLSHRDWTHLQMKPGILKDPLGDVTPPPPSPVSHESSSNTAPPLPPFCRITSRLEDILFHTHPPGAATPLTSRPPRPFCPSCVCVSSVVTTALVKLKSSTVHKVQTHTHTHNVCKWYPCPSKRKQAFVQRAVAENKVFRLLLIDLIRMTTIKKKTFLHT